MQSVHLLGQRRPARRITKGGSYRPVGRQVYSVGSKPKVKLDIGNVVCPCSKQNGYYATKLPIKGSPPEGGTNSKWWALHKTNFPLEQRGRGTSLSSSCCSSCCCSRSKHCGSSAIAANRLIHKAVPGHILGERAPSAPSQGVERLVGRGCSAYILDPSLILDLDTHIHDVAVLEPPMIVYGAGCY